MDEQGREPVEELTLEPTATVRTRRPPVLWAVLAAVGIATGALVVTSSDDDLERRPGLPVSLAFGGSGGGETAADASRLAWVAYVAGDELPSLGGEATAYRLSGDVDEARVRALADEVGLEGAVRRTEAGWSVTGEGGLGRLEVFTGGGAHWSWFGGHQDCATEDGSTVGCYEECTVDSDGLERCATSMSDVPMTTVVEGVVAVPPAAACAEPEPGEAPEDCKDVVTMEAPAGPVAPPDDVARVALDVAAAAGHDVDGATVAAVPSGGEEGTGQWHVTVEPRLGGVASGLLTFVEVSSDLRVLSASGVLGGAADLGAYPLLDTRAAIERANEQMGAMPAVAADDADRGSAGVAPGGGAAGTTGGTDGAGSTDVGGPVGDIGGATGEVGSVSTPSTTVDPCVVPEGASDGCGGTTGCGGDGCLGTTPPAPCKVQADGREICEVDPCPAPGTDPTSCPPSDCPQIGVAEAGAPEDGAPEDSGASAPAAPTCTPPPNPEPGPEPTPVEIVLVDAERSLVLLGATDGSRDAYLVPAYRFSAEDGGQVDLPAVANEALTGGPSTETTVPDTVLPPRPLPEPQPCVVLEEQDPESATTHTVQPCPTPNEDPGVLGEGEEPAIGVGYYVDIDLSCELVEFADALWINDDGTIHGWVKAGETHEGGTFTLEAEDRGTFVGDAAGTKVAELRRLQPNEDVFCTPEPRP